MKPTFKSILFLALAFGASGQETQTPENIDRPAQLQELRKRQGQLEEQLRVISAEIERLEKAEKERVVLTKSNPEIVRVKAVRQTVLWRDTLNQAFAPSVTIFAGDEMEVIESVPGYLHVRYDGQTGYVFHSAIEPSMLQPYLDEIKRIKDAEEAAKKAAAKAEADRKAAARKAALVKEYGQSIGEKIFHGQIWIGMTSAMAKQSRGTPSEINRTVTAGGVDEQWVYRSKYLDTVYLYFDNGILTSWQD